MRLVAFAATCILVAGCTTQPVAFTPPTPIVAPSTVAPSTAPGGLTGEVRVMGGQHVGTYPLSADAADVVCARGENQWSTGFASQQLTDGVTTLVVSGSSLEAGAPVDDFEMTIGATTEANTILIRPGQSLGTGTTTFRLEGDVVQVDMTGVTAEGVGVNVSLACTLQPGP
ncbi:MAG TPA: hypothetical protein VGQ58_06525 [Candidatus Limnocylindrales bacterium]|jgi:hypothetical protein|nr:hypothetical protein [Candidatus Limnocylindrales bacterium]